MKQTSIVFSNYCDFFTIAYTDNASYTRSVIPAIKRQANRLANRYCAIKQKNVKIHIDYDLSKSYTRGSASLNLVDVKIEYM